VRWARPATLVATVVLIGFTEALVVARIRGRTPACACFGGAEPTPVTALTLIRNLVPVAVGAVATATAPTRKLDGVVLVALPVAVASIAGAAAMITLIRRYGQALLRIQVLEGTLSALDGNGGAAFGTAVGHR
jgi:hypothetical protein